MKFGWKDGVRASVPATAVGAQLMKLYARHGRRLTPALVAAEARAKPKTPLGQLLEHDIQKAAEGFWKEQMRWVFRHLVFYPQSAKERAIAAEMRVFEVVYEQLDSDDEGNGPVLVCPVFRLHDDIMHSPVERAQVVAQAWKGLQEWRERYRHLNEFAKLFDAIDAALKGRKK